MKRRQKKGKWCLPLIPLLLLFLVWYGGTELEKTDSDIAEEEQETSDIENETESPSEDIDGEMFVHFLDVGQGLSVFVQCDGKNLIYDGGGRSTSSFVVAYLKNMGVETIDYLISSHYDSDHIAGLIGCLAAFDVKMVIGSDYTHDSKTYESFMERVEEEGLTMQYPAVGTTYEFGSGEFVILAPHQIDEEDSNGNSVVIRLSHGDNRFLFTGDAEHESEEKMCMSEFDVDCDVLVPGHHGSATATGWAWLIETTPQYAVISCGEGNGYGHPHSETMEKLETMEISLYRTDKQGNISVVSDGKSLIWSQEPCNDYSAGETE